MIDPVAPSGQSTSRKQQGIELSLDLISSQLSLQRVSGGPAYLLLLRGRYPGSFGMHPIGLFC